MATTTTLTTLRTRVYNLLNQDEDTKNYPYTLVDGLINNAQRVVLNTNPYDPRGDRQETSPKFPFLDTDQFYSSVSDGTLDGIAIVGATTLVLSSASNFPTSGSVWVGANIITYTGISGGTTFTGIASSGDGSIAFAHVSGTVVSALYDLPSDFGYAEELAYNHTTPMLFRDYGNIRKHMRGKRGASTFLNQSLNIDSFLIGEPFYTLVQANFILLLNISVNDQELHLRYQKQPTTLVNTTDISVIPNEYSVDTIPYFAAADVLFNRDDLLNAEKMRIQAIGKIKEMYDFFKRQAKESQQFSNIPTGKENKGRNF